MSSSHESRLTSELRRLLSTRRTAALGTLSADGRPYVSMTPYAIDTRQACLVILISGLAAHTRHIREHPQVSLLISDAEEQGQPVHALGRLTIEADAQLAEPGSDDAGALAQAYLKRFPEAEQIGALPDFRYVTLAPRAIRQIAGFGAARDVSLEEFQRLLQRVGGSGG